LVLASAGLDRLGRTEHIHQRFSFDEITPAPGQGALALETRCPAHEVVILSGAKDLLLDGAGTDRDRQIWQTVRILNDPTTEYATQAERAVLAALGGGCQLPLGAYCHQVDDHWHLHAMVVSPDGDQVAHVLKEAAIGTAATDLGHAVAEALIARGALELLRGAMLEEV
jgi:hydroxymethylbilane synthase